MYFFLNAMVTLSAVVFLVAPGTELAAVAVLLMDDAGDSRAGRRHVGAASSPSASPSGSATGRSCAA